MLKPTQTEHLKPPACTCGNADFPETHPYYTHQFIELPEIEMEVTHFVLYKGDCPCFCPGSRRLILNGMIPGIIARGNKKSIMEGKPAGVV